jgi:hypothetical protein
MAKVSKGNTLSTPVLQAGYTIENDGYGLLTCRATYKIDDNKTGNAPKRGDVFKPDPRLKCHKVSVSYGALGVAIITAEYCGIEAGDWTEPNVSGSATLSTEPLTSHPNFFVPSSKRGIAGPGPYTATASPDGTNKPAFLGANGAIFGNDGVAPNKPLFLGFFGTVTDAEKKLYKRTSYLSPVSSFNGVLYTTKAANVVTIRKYVGSSFNGRAPYGYRFLLPAYLGDNFEAKDETDQLLLSSVNFEDYGMLYKISYEIRFNREGYSREVYQSVSIVAG